MSEPVPDTDCGGWGEGPENPEPVPVWVWAVLMLAAFVAVGVVRRWWLFW